MKLFPFSPFLPNFPLFLDFPDFPLLSSNFPDFGQFFAVEGTLPHHGPDSYATG